MADTDTNLNNDTDPNDTPPVDQNLANTPKPPDSDGVNEPPVIISANKDDNDLVERLVNERLDGRLKPIKGKLDAAFKARDEAMTKLKQLEAEKHESELKKLEEEGKFREAYELRLAALNAEKEALKSQNTALSRDVAVKDALKTLPFRNDRAFDMAFKEIVGNLVQDENSRWVHRTGISVADYVKAFSADDEQAFLFKAKPNSGGGTPASTSGTPASSSKRSLFEMSQAEVLKLAAEGKIGKPPNFIG